MLIWYYIFIFWTCASIWCRNNQATLPSWPSSILGSPRPKRWETFFPPWKDLVLRVSIHFLLHNRHEIALVGHHGSFGWGVAMFHNVSPRRHHQNHVTRSEDESGFYSTQCCWSQNWHFHGFPLNFHWISTDFHGFPWISTEFPLISRLSILRSAPLRCPTCSMQANNGWESTRGFTAKSAMKPGLKLPETLGPLGPEALEALDALEAMTAMKLDTSWLTECSYVANIICYWYLYIYSCISKAFKTLGSLK